MNSGPFFFLLFFKYILQQMRNSKISRHLEVPFVLIVLYVHLWFRIWHIFFFSKVMTTDYLHTY